MASRNPSCPRAAFLFLCRCLAENPDDDARQALARDIQAEAVDWREILRQANEALAAPALWRALRRKGLARRLEPELRRYLSRLHRRNRKRNAALREQALEAARALNARGVVPAILKGGVHLFDRRLDPAARMLADIDLLVAPAQFADAAAALEDIGYRALDAAGEAASHALTFGRPDEVATIDLHRSVGPQRRLLATETALASAEPAVAEPGVALLAPSPTHRLLVSVMDSEILSPKRRMGLMPLKSLLDGAALARSGAAIDWEEVAGVFARHGLGHVFAAWTHAAHELLGVATPLGARPGWRARLHLRRCLAQLDHPGLARVAAAWARLSHPFDPVRMDYLYPGLYPGVNGRASVIGLARRRFVHARAVLRRHGSSILIADPQPRRNVDG